MLRFFIEAGTEVGNRRNGQERPSIFDLSGDAMRLVMTIAGHLAVKLAGNAHAPMIQSLAAKL